jgi:hypothetical protein
MNFIAEKCDVGGTNLRFLEFKDEMVFLASLENLFNFDGGVGMVRGEDKKVIENYNCPVFEVGKTRRTID